MRFALFGVSCRAPLAVWFAAFFLFLFVVLVSRSFSFRFICVVVRGVVVVRCCFCVGAGG